MPDESAPRDDMTAADTMAAADFDAMYQGGSVGAGLELAFETPPWVLGEPQPLLVDLESTGALRGEVLDAGCGSGDNALFLASRGHRVTGFDASRAALDQARRKARERSLDIEFLESDATRLDELPEGKFDSVLDSGLYHVLDEKQQRAYARALHRVARPGADLHMLCLADVPGPKTPIPPPVRPDDIRDRLGTHWDIRRIRLSRFTTSLTEELLTAQRDQLRAAAGVELDPAAMEYDGRGRLTSPCWHVHALRG